MGFRRTLSTAISKAECVPKGHFAVYVGGNERRRFVVPISYLGKPLFQELLSQAEDEFKYHHPMGGITIPCSPDFFLDLTSHFGFVISNSKSKPEKQSNKKSNPVSSSGRSRFKLQKEKMDASVLVFVHRNSSTQKL